MGPMGISRMRLRGSPQPRPNRLLFAARIDLAEVAHTGAGPSPSMTSPTTLVTRPSMARTLPTGQVDIGLKIVASG
jgi:hypothetical protein